MTSAQTVTTAARSRSLEALEAALDAAVATQFCKLFEVLMVDPSPAGFKRFEAGLTRLTETEKAVRKTLEDTQC
jgi:hypothetical protein